MKTYSIYVNDKYIGMTFADNVKNRGGTVLELYNHRWFWLDSLVCILKHSVLDKTNEDDLRIDVTIYDMISDKQFSSYY